MLLRAIVRLVFSMYRHTFPYPLLMWQQEQFGLAVKDAVEGLSSQILRQRHVAIFIAFALHYIVNSCPC
jgi:hypothetical protein